MLNQILRELVTSDAGSSNVLAQDFVLEVGHTGPLASLSIDSEQVSVLENPLAVRRELQLFTESEALRVVLGLCLEGPGAAREWLQNEGSAFQREPKAEDIQKLKLDQGATGFYWSWLADGSLAFAAFARHNFMATLNGRLATIHAVAAAIDHDVCALKTIPVSEIAQIEARSVEHIAAGGRFDLPVSDAPESQLFFIATGGAVNRDPAASGHYYYRAGQHQGRHTIDILRVGRGLLPERTRVSIQIG